MSDWYEIALQRLGWIEVTIWYHNGQHNHLEMGFANTERPTPKFASQRTAWSGGRWLAKHAWAKGSCPLVVLT